jgi:hypothetical protein
MLPYNSVFDPPAPALTIEVISPVTGLRRTVLAKFDTGADQTVIPEDLAADLSLSIQGQTPAAGFDNITQLYFAYLIDLIIAGRNFVDLQVIATSNDHILLGRDVLNDLLITLDGPQLQFAIH